MQQRQLRQIGAYLMTACALVGVFALAACGDNDSDENGSGKTTSFAPVEAAATDTAKRQVYGTDFATVDGQTRETGYVTILRSGERRGDSAALNVFGQILDRNMTPILADDRRLERLLVDPQARQQAVLGVAIRKPAGRHVSDRAGAEH